MHMGRRKRREPEKVEIIYARGLKRYMIVNGMISWGLTTGLLFLTLQSLWQKGLSFAAWKASFSSYQGLMTLALFMMAGLVWGRFTWPVVEKQVKNKVSGKTAVRRNK